MERREQFFIAPTGKQYGIPPLIDGLDKGYNRVICVHFDLRLYRLFFLTYGFLQSLSRTERGNSCCGNGDWISCTGVAPLPGRPFGNFKRSETHKRYGISFFQGLRDSVKHGINGKGRRFLSYLYFFRNSSDQVINWSHFKI
jgi:hypothetical protein